MRFHYSISPECLPIAILAVGVSSSVVLAVASATRTPSHRIAGFLAAVTASVRFTNACISTVRALVAAYRVARPAFCSNITEDAAQNTH